MKGKKTGGRQKGTVNKATAEVQKLCRRMVENSKYLTGIRKRLREGDLHPGVETMLWHYAYGKPKETVEVSGADGGPIETISLLELAKALPTDQLEVMKAASVTMATLRAKG